MLQTKASMSDCNYRHRTTMLISLMTNHQRQAVALSFVAFYLSEKTNKKSIILSHFSNLKFLFGPINSVQQIFRHTIEQRRNGRPFTTRILENSMAFSRSWSIEFCRVYEVLTILLHRSIHRLKFSLKSVNLCKLTARCTDVHSDKPHPRFDMKILSKKVQLTGFSN